MLPRYWLLHAATRRMPVHVLPDLIAGNECIPSNCRRSRAPFERRDSDQGLLQCQLRLLSSQLLDDEAASESPIDSPRSASRAYQRNVEVCLLLLHLLLPLPRTAHPRGLRQSCAIIVASLRFGAITWRHHILPDIVQALFLIPIRLRCCRRMVGRRAVQRRSILHDLRPEDHQSVMELIHADCR